MKSNEIKRIAAYCRVSTDNEDQTNSFESQQKYFKKYIEGEKQWELYKVFADQGISGTNTKKRKAFNDMIDCARKGKIDLIITKEISRFARNTLDSIRYTRELKSLGVGVLFLNDNINTLDGDAELRLAIMSSIAQEESRKTSERVKWGQKRSMEEGVVFGRNLLGYNVENGKIFVEEKGAKIVRLIFDKFVNEGKGSSIIARELREEGIFSEKISRWTSSNVIRIIKNEKYCGDLVQKKTYTPDFLSHEKKYNHGEEEFVIIKNHHEPVVSRELFEKANEILKTHSKARSSKYSNRYVFSGKIKCGLCGANYVARCKTLSNGKQYLNWKCFEAKENGAKHKDKRGVEVGCDSKTITNDDAVKIMATVCENININRGKIVDEILKMAKSVCEKNDVSYKDKNIHKEKMDRLTELYINGDITKEYFTMWKQKYEDQIKCFSIISGNECNYKWLADIRKIIEELINGVDYEDSFYREILDRIVVNESGEFDVYLKFIDDKWKVKVE